MATVSVPSLLHRGLISSQRGLFQSRFVCKRCLHQQRQVSARAISTRSPPFFDSLRQSGARQTRAQSIASPAPPLSPSSPLGALSQSIGRKPLPRSSTVNQASSWPETSSKSVAYWLLASAASVFGIVVFGGLTRLTESGLSITEWRPVTGSFPPRNEAVWEEEFERYKRSPEFKMLNSRMSLEEFKQIYWMEWGHRLWGRVVGLTLIVPTVYFIARRRMSPTMAWRSVGICGLVGFQGFLGWWMVKSGLKDDLLETGAHPRVSQYRLAAHLGTAFVVYLSLLYNGLSILRDHALLRDPASGLRMLETLQSPALRPFRRYLVPGLGVLVFTTALSGALVAGLDAGLIYNDFPWMGQNLLPPQREILDPFYSHTPDNSDLLWRNMLENPVLAQLDHRLLATSTFAAVLALWAYTRARPAVRAALPLPAKSGVLGLVHLVTLQVVLGISTLWYLCPVPLAAAHQAGALLLLSGVVVLGSRIRVAPRTLSLVRRAAEAQLRGVQAPVARRVVSAGTV